MGPASWWKINISSYDVEKIDNPNSFSAWSKRQKDSASSITLNTIFILQFSQHARRRYFISHKFCPIDISRHRLIFDMTPLRLWILLSCSTTYLNIVTLYKESHGDKLTGYGKGTSRVGRALGPFLLDRAYMKVWIGAPWFFGLRYVGYGRSLQTIFGKAEKQVFRL